jgi:hypothetical protein
MLEIRNECQKQSTLTTSVATRKKSDHVVRPYKNRVYDQPNFTVMHVSGIFTRSAELRNSMELYCNVFGRLRHAVRIVNLFY